MVRYILNNPVINSVFRFVFNGNSRALKRSMVLVLLSVMSVVLMFRRLYNSVGRSRIRTLWRTA